NVIAGSHFTEPASGNFLTDAGRVNIRCIEEVHTGFERGGKMLTRFICANRPFAPRAVAVTHASEANARHGHSCFTQLRVLHDGLLFLLITHVRSCSTSDKEGREKTARRQVRMQSGVRPTRLLVIAKKEGPWRRSV